MGFQRTVFPSLETATSSQKTSRMNHHHPNGLAWFPIRLETSIRRIDPSLWQTLVFRTFPKTYLKCHGKNGKTYDNHIDNMANLTYFKNALKIAFKAFEVKENWQYVLEFQADSLQDGHNVGKGIESTIEVLDSTATQPLWKKYATVNLGSSSPISWGEK